MARFGSAQRVRVDDEGRLVIPEKMRRQVKIRPGDVYFVRADKRILRYARVRNPFEGLARQAVSDFKSGKTRPLREFARDEDVTLNEQ